MQANPTQRSEPAKRQGGSGGRPAAGGGGGRGAPPAEGLRAGVIGLGFIGEVHVRAIRAAGGTVRAVAGSTPERSAAVAARLGGVRAVAAEELIADDAIDVVHVCTPNHLHAPLVRAALSAGKHVVCEKPLATNREDAEELAAAAAAAGVVATVPFVYRFYPSVRDARARVATDETGPLRLLHGSYLQAGCRRPSTSTGASTRRSAVRR